MLVRVPLPLPQVRHIHSLPPPYFRLVLPLVQRLILVLSLSRSASALRLVVWVDSMPRFSLILIYSLT